VDPIQWQPGWVRAPQEVIAAWHAAVLPQERWIIDGWRSWDLICARFTAADTIILVDHPLRVHLWWALKRQALSVVQPQPGGSSGCPLLPVTGRMLQVIWRVHRLYRPELLTLIAEMEGSKRIICIRSPREMQRFTQRITTRS
jgi:hypothetical protein